MGRAEREKGPGVRGNARVLCCKCGCQQPTRAGGIKCAQVLLLLPPRGTGHPLPELAAPAPASGPRKAHLPLSRAVLRSALELQHHVVVGAEADAGAHHVLQHGALLGQRVHHRRAGRHKRRLRGGGGRRASGLGVGKGLDAGAAAWRVRAGRAPHARCSPPSAFFSLRGNYSLPLRLAAAPMPQPQKHTRCLPARTWPLPLSPLLNTHTPARPPTLVR